MLGFLATSYAPITDNDILTDKPYFCLGLLSNLADLLRPVDSISTLLLFFGPYSPTRDGVPMGTIRDY